MLQLAGLIFFVSIIIVTITAIENKLLNDQVQSKVDLYKPAFISMPVALNPVAEKAIIKHNVARGDSLGIISAKYNIPWERIYNKNVTMQWTGDLKIGQEIIIPAAEESLEHRPIPSSYPANISTSVNSAPAQAQKAPATTNVVNTKTGSATGNLYAKGNCTWYVKSKRPDLPNSLGNANTWASRAKSQGLQTGSVPRVGAVGQRGNHVVYVESVNQDGTVTFSEMNYRRLYAITRRTLPANYFTYIY